MKKIAVILCSKTKKDYACEAWEMYNDSHLFTAKQAFLDMMYDEWYINTAVYGFMKPTQHIEPYESSYLIQTSSNSQLKNSGGITDKEEIDRWLDKLDKAFPDKNNIEIHSHMSGAHTKLLKKIFPNVVYVKSEISFTSTAWKYVDACRMALAGATLDECLEFINTPTPKWRAKETKKWFYHMDGREFFGNAYDITKKFTDLDNGCMYGLSNGVVQMSHGWATDKALLPYIYLLPSGRFRLDKRVKTPHIKPRRSGLKEAILEVNERLQNERAVDK